MFAALVVPSCLVSFEDYPAGGADAGVGGAAGAGAGGLGGSGIDASMGGAGAVGGSAGVGASGGIAGIGAGDASAGASGAGAGGSAGQSCSSWTFTASADTQICLCGANVHGTSQTLNIGACIGLFVFDLTTLAAQWILQEPNVELELKLQRVDGHTECSGICPAAAGAIVARPMRTDWVEGVTGSDYSGADHCRRSAGNPGQLWGAPGASKQTPPEQDVWPASGNPSVLASYAQQSSLVIQLSHGPHKQALAEHSSMQIGIRLETQGGTFVAASRELGTPELRVTRCSSN